MKAVKELIITELKKKGIDFKKDYYELKHSQIAELARYGKQIKYKCPDNGKGYAYNFYMSLKRLANKK